MLVNFGFFVVVIVILKFVYVCGLVEFVDLLACGGRELVLGRQAADVERHPQCGPKGRLFPAVTKSKITKNSTFLKLENSLVM
jgi:hypothetical protein